MAAKSPSDVKQLSFEDALKQLESIVTDLESGNIKLEDAIESYAKGAELKKHCETKLQSAKLKVEKVTNNQ